MGLKLLIVHGPSVQGRKYLYSNEQELNEIQFDSEILYYCIKTVPVIMVPNKNILYLWKKQIKLRKLIMSPK